MKKNIKYFMMAAVALLSMSACNNEMDEQDPANNGKLQPVQFQTSIAGTRTSTTPDHVTTFANGDEIGLFVYAENGVIGTDTPIYSNVKLTYSDGTWTSETPIYPEVAYDYYAYYPYQANTQEGINPTKIAINVNPNQNVVNNYNVSDVLATDKIAATINATTVNLSFKHAYAMIEAKISGSLVSAAPTSVVLNNVKTEASLTLGSPSAGVAEGAVADVTMGSINEDATSNIYTYRAVVPAQDIAGGGTLITVTLADGKKYQMKAAASGAKYVAAKYTLLDVNIGTAKPSVNVTTNDQSISAWEGNGSIAENTTEVVTPVTSFTLPLLTTDISATYTYKGWSAATTTKASGEEDFWFRRENGKAPLATISYTNDAITLQHTTKGSWNNSNISFHCAKPFEQTIYQISITGSSNIADGSMGIAISNYTDNKLFQLAANSEMTGKLMTVRSFKINKDGTADNTHTVSTFINMAKCSTTGSSDFSSLNPPITTFDTATKDDTRNINIYLYNYTDNSTLSIKEIKIEKFVASVQ